MRQNFTRLPAGQRVRVAGASRARFAARRSAAARTRSNSGFGRCLVETIGWRDRTRAYTADDAKSSGYEHDYVPGNVSIVRFTQIAALRSYHSSRRRAERTGAQSVDPTVVLVHPFGRAGNGWNTCQSQCNRRSQPSTESPRRSITALIEAAVGRSPSFPRTDRKLQNLHASSRCVQSGCVRPIKRGNYE